MAGASNANIFTHARGVVLVVPWLLYLLLADIALSSLLLLKPFAPDLVYDTSSFIAESVWRWIQAIFERFNGARITYSGDALPRGESAIVVTNHVGWSDFYMIQGLAIRCGMLGRCRYFAKIQLKNVPFLGWGLWAMGFPLVSRNWGKDKHELDRVFSGIVSRKWPTCKCCWWGALCHEPRTNIRDAPRVGQLQRSNTIYSSEIPRVDFVVQGEQQAAT